MTKMTSIKKAIFAFLIVDVFIIAISLFVGKNWLINTQLAFFSSLFIIFGTFAGYKNLVTSKAEAEEERLKNEEEIDESEKESGLKKSMSNLGLTMGAALSFYRIIGYALLFLSMFFLARTSMFEPLAFFVGVSGIIVGALLFGILKRD
ncbi:MAG: hypothetical protein ACK5LP_08465 [Campylobacteraceae bacterium]